MITSETNTSIRPAWGPVPVPCDWVPVPGDTVMANCDEVDTFGIVVATAPNNRSIVMWSQGQALTESQRVRAELVEDMRRQALENEDRRIFQILDMLNGSDD